jgi:hypothetical protein
MDKKYLLIQSVNVPLSGTVLLSNHFNAISKGIFQFHVDVIRHRANINVLVFDSDSVLESDWVRGKEMAVEEFRKVGKHNLGVSEELICKELELCNLQF